jgi:hypothetical protein
VLWRALELQPPDLRMRRASEAGRAW